MYLPKTANHASHTKRVGRFMVGGDESKTLMLQELASLAENIDGTSRFVSALKERRVQSRQ